MGGLFRHLLQGSLNALLILRWILSAPQDIFGYPPKLFDLPGSRSTVFDVLKQRIEDHALPLAAFQWYLDLRKYGSVPHAGFGMGIERVVAWLCGLDHVRETIPFARTLNRIYP